MNENIRNDLINSTTSAVVFPVNEYSIQINDVVKVLSENFGKILYVSLNRLYNPLKRKIIQEGIDSSRFVFVDAVTKTAIAQPKEETDCIFVSSPDALTELSIAITKTIQTSYPDIIIFDSLSTLLIYENSQVTTQFIHSLINKMTAFGVKMVFTILEGEKEQPLINNLNMLLDKVIKINDSDTSIQN
jgi:archaellum biogenesis ATPase FlaH